MILNLGAGYPRVNAKKYPDWWNVDYLHPIFPEDAPEREVLEKELQYVEHNLLDPPMPFDNDSVDGVVLNHVLEHFNMQQTVEVLVDVRRVLKPGAWVRVSVPDPGMFHEKTINGDNNWGEPNYGEKDGLSFMEYALFFYEHVQMVTEDALKCYFWIAGFVDYQKMEFQKSRMRELTLTDNRSKFSLFFEGRKP